MSAVGVSSRGALCKLCGVSRGWGSLLRRASGECAAQTSPNVARSAWRMRKSLLYRTAVSVPFLILLDGAWVHAGSLATSPVVYSVPTRVGSAVTTPYLIWLHTTSLGG